MGRLLKQRSRRNIPARQPAVAVAAVVVDAADDEEEDENFMVGQLKVR